MQRFRETAESVWLDGEPFNVIVTIDVTNIIIPFLKT